VLSVEAIDTLQATFQTTFQTWLTGFFALSAESFLQQLSRLFFDPDRRTYWLFLVTALGVAIWVMSRAEGFRPLDWGRRLLSRDYLLSRSSAVDVGYWALNRVVLVLAVIPLVGGHLALTLEVVRGLRASLGAPPDIGTLPVGVMLCLYTGVFLVVEDASRFYLHYAMHRAPLLWRFHRVHHSATCLTPLTLYRIHPVEMTLYYLRGALVFALVTGVFVYFWGADVKGWQILGVDAIGFLFNLAAANLRHSHIWVSFGALERVFISPAQHQLHHSAALEHRQCNYGAILACWDRWARSWLPAGPRRALTFGLSPQRRDGNLS
jgi:sterol desaturase/sphingolipid hydroxylase (fatty acid hydroxylase superfamily)